MLINHPKVLTMMEKSKEGHIETFLYHKPFKLDEETEYMASVNQMVRPDNTIYFRCVVEACNELIWLDVEYLDYDGKWYWSDWELGVSNYSQALGKMIEENRALN